MENQFGTGKRSHIFNDKDQAETLLDAERIRILEKSIPSRVKSEIFCVRLRNLLPTRHTGDPLQFVDDRRTDYAVERMCEVLKLTRSSFYRWKATRARRASKTYADDVLGARIATVFDNEDGL